MDSYGNSVGERIRNFDAVHGASAYDGCWLYYEDGALREGDPWGSMQEPPTDARQRYQNIARHHQILLKKKVVEFDNLKATLRENPGLYPDSDENLARLRVLQGDAREIQRCLRLAQEELKRQVPGYRTPEEEEECIQLMAATATAKHNYVSALDDINI